MPIRQRTWNLCDILETLAYNEAILWTLAGGAVASSGAFVVSSPPKTTCTLRSRLPARERASAIRARALFLMIASVVSVHRELSFSLSSWKIAKYKRDLPKTKCCTITMLREGKRGNKKQHNANTAQATIFTRDHHDSTGRCHFWSAALEPHMRAHELLRERTSYWLDNKSSQASYHNQCMYKFGSWVRHAKSLFVLCQSPSCHPRSACYRTGFS